MTKVCTQRKNLGDGTSQCLDCGDICATNHHKPCKKQVQMTIAQRLASFTHALYEFAKGHGEFLPKEKIKERLDICSRCPHFTGDHCNICGCGVGPEQKLMNKLAHPMTFCPDKPPRWDKSPL